MTHYTFRLLHSQGFTKVRVIETASLLELADILLESIEFELDHAFGFHSDLTQAHAPNQQKEFTCFADQGEAFVDHDRGVENTNVNEIFSEGETLLFHFDYGEDWMFFVTCEKIETTKSRRKKPEILEVEGDAPEQYPEEAEDWDSLESEEEPANIIAFNPKTNERISITPNDKDDYEIMVTRISKANEKIIRKFADHLLFKKLSEKTVEKHCSNIDFYGNDYLIHYVEEEITVDQAPFFISNFLGSWFIRKCMWSSETALKENITSFKKFYGWLHDTGSLSSKDYGDFMQMLKEEKEQWLKTMRKYDDPDTDFEEVFSDDC